MTISAIILAKNEEKNIAECIKSVSFCDEIIVIDDNSTDDTASIAKKLKAKVVSHALKDDFAQQRDFATQQAKGDWVLFVDADERVSSDLQKEILNKINNENIGGYYIQRYDHVFGKFLKHGETGDIFLLRLARKDAGIWKGRVHEVLITDKKTGVLKHPLLHYPHITIGEFLSDVNFYSTLRAKELYESKQPVSWFDIILYPKAKFLKNYVSKMGFLDGVPGFIMAAMMSFHSFLVRGKLWQLYDKSS